MRAAKMSACSRIATTASMSPNRPSSAEGEAGFRGMGNGRTAAAATASENSASPGSCIGMRTTAPPVRSSSALRSAAYSAACALSSGPQRRSATPIFGLPGAGRGASPQQASMSSLAADWRANAGSTVTSIGGRLTPMDLKRSADGWSRTVMYATRFAVSRTSQREIGSRTAPSPGRRTLPEPAY